MAFDTHREFLSPEEIPMATLREYMDAFREAREQIASQQTGSPTAILLRNIVHALSVLADFYHAENAYVLRFDIEMNVGLNAYEWHRAGEDRSIVNQAVFFDLDGFPMLKHHSVSEELVIMDIESIRERWPRDYEAMTLKGIKSFYSATMPKALGNVGYVALNNPSRFIDFPSFLHLASLYIAMQLQAIGEHRQMDLAKKDQMSLEENDMRINLLGFFEAITQKGIITLDDLSSEQCSKLAVCLLRNRDRRHSIDDIFEMLWPNRITDNPYDAVKSIVYRMRKNMVAVCEKPLIVAAKGTFIINPEINPILDTDMFLELCKKASDENLPKFDRLTMCRKAAALYRGDLMSGVDISEHWLMTRRSHYRLVYASLMKTFIKLLIEVERYTEMADVISASQGVVFSDPQIQWLLIQTFMDTKRYDLALNHFHVASKLLTREQKIEFQNLWDKRE
jgi:two-component SAPR family response regulator